MAAIALPGEGNDDRAAFVAAVVDLAAEVVLEAAYAVLSLFGIDEEREVADEDRGLHLLVALGEHVEKLEVLVVGSGLNADLIDDEKIDVRELPDDVLFRFGAAWLPRSADALDHGSHAGEEHGVTGRRCDLCDGACKVRLAGAGIAGHDDPITVIDMLADVLAELDDGRTSLLLFGCLSHVALDGAVLEAQRNGKASHQGRLLALGRAARA